MESHPATSRPSLRRTNTSRRSSKLIQPRGRIGLIDDPKALDVMPLKQKSLALCWEFMFARPMFHTDDMDAQHCASQSSIGDARLDDDARTHSVGWNVRAAHSRSPTSKRPTSFRKVGKRSARPFSRASRAAELAREPVGIHLLASALLSVFPRRSHVRLAQPREGKERRDATRWQTSARDRWWHRRWIWMRAAPAGTRRGRFDRWPP